MEPTPSLDIATKSLTEEGVFDMGDSEVGEHIREFEKKGFPFYTEEGLDFLIQHIQ